MPDIFSKEEPEVMNAYWHAANYLSIGQIYLYDNPLLKEPLKLEHIKPRLLGHWAATPGLNFIYVHLNHLIRNQDISMIYICGPSHGGHLLKDLRMPDFRDYAVKVPEPDGLTGQASRMLIRL